jgi:hypothetical protein
MNDSIDTPIDEMSSEQVRQMLFMLTVKELKKLAEEYNRDTKGNKAQIIDNLLYPEHIFVLDRSDEESESDEELKDFRKFLAEMGNPIPLKKIKDKRLPKFGNSGYPIDSQKLEISEQALPLKLSYKKRKRPNEHETKSFKIRVPRFNPEKKSEINNFRIKVPRFSKDS